MKKHTYVMIMIALFANVAWGLCVTYDDCMSSCENANPGATCNCYETPKDTKGTRISLDDATTCYAYSID